MPTSEPRRVTILIDSLLGGGAERIAVEAAGALDPARWTPHVLVTRSGGPLEERARELGLRVTLLGRSSRLDAGAFRRALAVTRGGDLIHAHKFSGSMLAAVLARLGRRPLVTHEHTLYERPSRVRRLGYRWLIGRTARRVVCVSESVAAGLRAGGVPEALLVVVPNGVPLEAALPRDAARAELGLDEPSLVIGMVGRLRPEKRHALAIRSVAALRDRGLDATLCLVGDGPCRAELERLTSDLGLGEVVRFAGERPDARRLIAAFDACLLCSSFEGMPLAALETLVVGVPLVATAVGSLPELLAGTPERLVPVDASPERIASALRQALAEGPGSGNAAARARAAFGIDRVARDLERVYDEVLTR